MKIPSSVERLERCVDALQKSTGVSSPWEHVRTQPILLEMMRQEFLSDTLNSLGESKSTNPDLIKALSEIVTALYRTQ